MTGTLPSDVWVPVHLRWRSVQPGDVFVGAKARLWHVVGVSPTSGGQLSVAAGSRTDSVHVEVDPDDLIPVLIPVPERDAVELSSDVLGARLLERRTSPAPRED